MFGLQPLHLVLMVFIALLIFGPSRLPDLGRAVRKTINEFRSATQDRTKNPPTGSATTIEPESTTKQS